jgi:hypothetical protein
MVRIKGVYVTVEPENLTDIEIPKLVLAIVHDIHHRKLSTVVEVSYRRRG